MILRFCFMGFAFVIYGNGIVCRILLLIRVAFWGDFLAFEARI